MGYGNCANTKDVPHLRERFKNNKISASENTEKNNEKKEHKRSTAGFKTAMP